MHRYTSHVLAVALLPLFLPTMPGEGSPSQPQLAVAAPGQPTDVSADPGNASALVTWTPPAENGGSPLHKYQIEWWADGQQVSSTAVWATEVSATAMWLQNGTSYTFTVQAQNEEGIWGARSEESALKTPRNICTITGTRNDDVLSGTAGNDAICGLGGDDVIDGADGSDTLLGGAGSDTADYDAAEQYLYLSLNDPARAGAGYAASGQYLDNVQDFEVVRGTAFDDSLLSYEGATLVGGLGDDALAGIGLGADDTLRGNKGDDQLFGYWGSDLLSGGAGDDKLAPGGRADEVLGDLGSDTLILEKSRNPVTVDLLAGTSRGQGEPVDTLTAVENVIGSRFADTLIGSSTDNVLDGGKGDDALVLGMGSDFADGGEGVDTVTFHQAVWVDLSAGTVFGEGLDTVSYIENVVGSPADDRLTGDAAANRLVGGGGDDRLSGVAGDDSLLGLGGDDVLNGGGGADRCNGGTGVDVATASCEITTSIP